MTDSNTSLRASDKSDEQITTLFKQGIADLVSQVEEHTANPDRAKQIVTGTLRKLADSRTVSTSLGLLEQRVRLADYMREGVPGRGFLPTPTLGERLFYDQGTFIVSGHKKSGKSWAMLTTALDCVRAGTPTVYLDFENGERLFTKRLLLLGADAQQVDEQLHYIPFPRELSLDSLHTELEAIADALPGAFVVIDSLRGAIARLSPSADPLKVNDPQSIERVCGPMMEVAKTRGVTVGIIDHSTKVGTDQDEYSTAGSAAKEQAVDAVYFWTKIEPYSKEKAGVVKISATSDRDGELDFERFYRVGGQGDGQFYFTATDKAGTQAAGRIMEDVRQFLADSSGEQTKTAIRKAVKGDNTAVDKALAWLVAHDDAIHAVSEGNKPPKYVWDSEREAAVDLLNQTSRSSRSGVPGEAAE
jgi:KaiC/GvpD/RAD55 family RecA-like ATPase